MTRGSLSCDRSTTTSLSTSYLELSREGFSVWFVISVWFVGLQRVPARDLYLARMILLARVATDTIRVLYHYCRIVYHHPLSSCSSLMINPVGEERLFGFGCICAVGHWHFYTISIPTFTLLFIGHNGCTYFCGGDGHILCRWSGSCRLGSKSKSVL